MAECALSILSTTYDGRHYSSSCAGASMHRRCGITLPVREDLHRRGPHTPGPFARQALLALHRSGDGLGTRAVPEPQDQLLRKRGHENVRSWHPPVKGSQEDERKDSDAIRRLRSTRNFSRATPARRRRD